MQGPRSVTSQSPDYGERVQVPTWYGAEGDVELHGPFWHLVGLWGLEVPHPPLVNLLVRRGLPLGAKRELSFKQGPATCKPSRLPCS